VTREPLEQDAQEPVLGRARQLIRRAFPDSLV